MLFYLQKTKAIRDPDSSQLFVSFSTKNLEKPVSKSCIAKWLTSVIDNAYRHFGKVPPEGVKAHSTRKVASSVAALYGVSIADVCRSATWSNDYVFARHYRLDMAKPDDESSFSRAVLRTVLPTSQ